MPSRDFERKDYLGEYSFKSSPLKMGNAHLKTVPFNLVTEVTKEKTQEESLGFGEKKENVDKKLSEMEERMTDRFQGMLKQILENLQTKQVVKIQEEKKKMTTRKKLSN